MVCLGIGTLLSRIRLQSSAVLLGLRDLSGPKSHSGSARLAPEVSRLRQSFSCCSASANELNFSPHERHGNSLSSMSLRSGTRGSFILISAGRRCATGMPRSRPILRSCSHWNGFCGFFNWVALRCNVQTQALLPTARL
jgi:hypothetical protein